MLSVNISAHERARRGARALRRGSAPCRFRGSPSAAALRNSIPASALPQFQDGRCRTGRRPQHDTGHRPGVPLLQRLVQNPAPREQMLGCACAVSVRAPQRGLVARSAGGARGASSSALADGLCQVLMIALGDKAGGSVLECFACLLVAKGSRRRRRTGSQGSRQRQPRMPKMPSKPGSVQSEMIRSGADSNASRKASSVATRVPGVSAVRPQLPYRQLGVGWQALFSTISNRAVVNSNS